MSQRRFLDDANPRKINLDHGVYRDANGQPGVLPSVQMAKDSLGDFDDEYLTIYGFKPFLVEATKILFIGTRAMEEEREMTKFVISLIQDYSTTVTSSQRSLHVSTSRERGLFFLLVLR